MLLICILFTVNASASAKRYPKAASIETLQLLNNKELSKIFKGGTTIVGTNLKWQNKAVQKYYSDNTYKGLVANGRKRIAGTWSIKNDMICHSPKNRSKNICRSVYKDGAYLVELNKKKMISILKFKVKKQK